MTILRTVWMLTRETFDQWWNDKAPRSAAALSYYTLFALAPLLVIVIAVAGVLFGREAAQGRLIGQLTSAVGADAARALQSMLANAGSWGGGTIATTIGLATLVVGTTGVVSELQDALNTVWKVAEKPGRGIRGLVLDRLVALAIVMTFGLLLIASLSASAIMAAASSWLHGVIPEWLFLGHLLGYGLSLGVLGVMLAVIFKVLPDVRMAWSDVWIGAGVTSVLLHLGKYLIVLYLQKAGLVSAFGAAGSVAVLLVWIYYISLLVLLGAEFTRTYAKHFGTHLGPDK